MAGSWRESRVLRLGLGALVALVLAEGLVRLLLPSFGDLAASPMDRHAYRIHANPRGHEGEWHHPDTEESHRIIHNDLGLRQHRPFDVEKPGDTARIGLFGDSFTENLRLEAPYSLSEPLDYLLNEAGLTAEVLNFGTDSYGTDQVWLQYRDEAPARSLDVVVYLFCHNDLTDLLANRLFTLSPEGDLRYRPVPETRLAVRAVRRFALTYLALFVRSRLVDRSTHFGWYDPDTATTRQQELVARRGLPPYLIFEKSERRERALALFRTLVREMQRETRRRGQELLVVLLPRNGMANALVAVELAGLGVPALDLFQTFLADRAIRDSFFERDPHWNEEGNKVAAVHLFRHLAAERGLPGGDAFVRRTLTRYYGAFDRDRVTGRWLDAALPAPAERERIRARYLALEGDA